MSKIKPQVEITGTLAFPLTVGISAYIAEADGCIRTSTVLNIRTQTRATAVFETRNTVYTLHLMDERACVPCGKAVADA
jgi:hypothetical protein